MWNTIIHRMACRKVMDQTIFNGDILGTRPKREQIRLFYGFSKCGTKMRCRLISFNNLFSTADEFLYTGEWFLWKLFATWPTLPNSKLKLDNEKDLNHILINPLLNDHFSLLLEVLGFETALFLMCLSDLSIFDPRVRLSGKTLHFLHC